MCQHNIISLTPTPDPEAWFAKEKKPAEAQKLRKTLTLAGMQQTSLQLPLPGTSLFRYQDSDESAGSDYVLHQGGLHVRRHSEHQDL